MMLANRSNRSRSRSLRPVMVSLEERVLLNAAVPRDLYDPRVSAQVQGYQNHKSKQRSPARPSHPSTRSKPAALYSIISTGRTRAPARPRGQT